MATPTKYLKSKFMADSILSQVTSLGVGPNTLVSNLARSGQLGTGIRFTKLDGATPAVFNPVVGVVLQVPSMWDRWPKLQEMLRAIMETHAKSITGIDFGYTLETQETQVGHDGQTLKVPTRTTRGQVNPTATIQEYPGMPVYNLFRTWMFDIQHPDTNFSAMPSEMLNSKDEAGYMPGWFMSAYSMSMIFIQYDPSGLPDRIYDAAIITNMFPTEIGEIGFERTIGTTQLKERSINFAGLVQHNENTRELGMRIAQMLALHKINYNFALPGLAGSTNPTVAVQSNIRPFGGLEYEAGSTREGGTDYVGEANTNRTGVDGSIQQFSFRGYLEKGLRESNNRDYDDQLGAPGNNPAFNRFQDTGAAKANKTADLEPATAANANSFNVGSGVLQSSGGVLTRG